MIKTGIMGGIGIVTFSSIIERIMKNYDTDIQPPVDTVSIIMPTYNEEEFIEKSASSIRQQSIITKYPQYFEFIIVDNGSTDNTMKIAKIFADKVVQSPRGKLSARNLGTKISKGNIIVAVDSDVYYPPHWLNTLLKPFNDNSDNHPGYPRYPEVVAVSGTILDYNFPGIPKSIYIIGSAIGRITYPTRMYGANCAYYKHTLYTIGEFREDIDQFDVDQMMAEEENMFGERLLMSGKVIYKFNAACIHLGSLRTGCRMGFVDKSSDTCKAYKFGIERFGGY